LPNIIIFKQRKTKLIEYHGYSHGCRIRVLFVVEIERERDGEKSVSKKSWVGRMWSVLSIGLLPLSMDAVHVKVQRLSLNPQTTSSQAFVSIDGRSYLQGNMRKLVWPEETEERPRKEQTDG
jgi:hypothetical protein